ncbi:hypothetical protein Pcinc_040964, partial [Petrolisthes cinctipes]
MCRCCEEAADGTTPLTVQRELTIHSAVSGTGHLGAHSLAGPARRLGGVGKS